jgi:uncharacterized membrane protein
MILELSANSSPLVRAIAALVLGVHVTAGCVGVFSGAAALLLRKGSPLHRKAGNLFFVAMLTMSAIGACIAPFLPHRISSVAAAFTFYLVATSWVTVRRREGSAGYFETGAFLFALGIVATGLTLGRMGANTPTGLLDGEPYQGAFVFAGAAALAAAGDLVVIVRRGISGAGRLTRHLWRMCVALLIGAISFFLGQPQLFPESVRGSFILYVPEIAILGSMLFWLIRLRFANSAMYTRPVGQSPL